MKTELEILYTWLQKKYRQELDIQMDMDLSSLNEKIHWKISGIDDIQIADLLDRETGIWIRFHCLSETFDAKKLSLYVEQDVQWGLNKMASLMRKSGHQKSEIDDIGAWQIHLVWLIDEVHHESWCAEMQSLRSQSGYSEELGLDAIFYGVNKLEVALDEHKLPQLLVATRKLLCLKFEDIGTWTSANTNFSKEFKNLPQQFSKNEEHELVQNFVNAVMSQYENTQKNLPKKQQIQKKPTRLKITGLRNIQDAEIFFSSNENNVDVKVIHGPNGTGKSSIFEALSLAISGVSIGLAEYLRDGQRDLTPTERNQYISRVLQGFNSDILPSVSIDGRDGLANLVSSAEEANTARINADGTLLAQEDARNFVQESGSSLGTRILSGYSTLAQIAQIQVDKEFQDANQSRKDWLSKFDLNASITKRETRIQKLILHYIETQLPRAPQQISDWLTILARLIPKQIIRAQALSAQWMRIDSSAEREDISLRIANAERLGFGVEILNTWIKSRYQIILNISELITENKSALEILAANLPEIQQDLEMWSKWLIERQKMEQAVQVDAENLKTSDQEIATLTKELFDLTETGRKFRIQFDHLKAVIQDPLPRWIESHPDRCPTCDAVYEQGIATVINQLLSELDQKIIKMREAYSIKQQKLNLLRKQQASTGQCPLSKERQSQLSTLVYLSEPEQESLSVSLLQPEFVSTHIASLQRLINIPALSDLEKNSLPVTDVSKRIMESVAEQDAIGEALWSLPDCWKSLKKSVDDIALQIVTKHLPSTLETVWLELVFFLTPARWNIAGNPRLKPDIARGTQKLKVTIQPINGAKHSDKVLLARFAFNQAEQHILGMAWFFTRYLTHGRFLHSLIALDDPAQEMDQTTYRAFVRWLQVFSRLHNIHNIPLSLVAFLHQEDRALDLARATSQKITILQWARTLRTGGLNATVQELILRNEEQKPSLPEIFRANVVPIVSV